MNSGKNAKQSEFLSRAYIRSLPRDKLDAALHVLEDLFDRTTVGETALIALLDTDKILEATELVETLLGDDAPRVQEEPTGSGLADSLIRAFVTPSARARRIGRLLQLRRRAKALWNSRAISQNESTSGEIEVIFAEADKRLVIILTSDIRRIVMESQEISQEHKGRLIKIVNSLDQEVNRPHGRYKVFLDGLLDAAEVMGQAGEKVKPVVDRIREIMGVAEGSQKEIKRIEYDKPLQLPPPGMDVASGPKTLE